jgi:hypothetical protein
MAIVGIPFTKIFDVPKKATGTGAAKDSRNRLPMPRGV